MATNRTSWSDISNVIKQTYTPERVDDAVIYHDVLASMMLMGRSQMITPTSSPAKYDGNRQKVVVFTSNQTRGGAGQVAATGALPSSNDDGEDIQFVFGPAEFANVLHIKADLLRSASADVVVDEAQRQIDGQIKTNAHLFNSLLYGDGSGKLATVTGAQDDATVSGEDYAYTCTVDEVAAVPMGQLFDIYDSTGSTARATGAKLVRQSTWRGPGTITFVTSTATSGVVSGDLIYIQNAAANGATQMLGLDAHVAATGNWPTGATGYINRANYINYQSAVIDAGSFESTNLYELFDAMISHLSIQSGRQLREKKGDHIIAKDLAVIVCDPNVKRELAAEMRDKQRYADYKVEDLGFTTTAYDGCPIVTDPKARNAAYFLQLDQWSIYKDPHYWHNGTDGIWQRRGGYDYMEAYGTSKFQTYCRFPAQQGKIHTISTQTVKDISTYLG